MSNKDKEVDMLPTMLRYPAVRNATGLPKSTIYYRIQQGFFPKPISLGPRTVGWLESEVAAISEARIAGKSDDEIRELVKQLEAARVAPAEQ